MALVLRFGDVLQRRVDSQVVQDGCREVGGRDGLVVDKAGVAIGGAASYCVTAPSIISLNLPPGFSASTVLESPSDTLLNSTPHLTW